MAYPHLVAGLGIVAAVAAGVQAGAVPAAGQARAVVPQPNASSIVVPQIRSDRIVPQNQNWSGDWYNYDQFMQLMESGEIVKYQPRNETEARLYRDYRMMTTPTALHPAIMADYDRYINQFTGAEVEVVPANQNWSGDWYNYDEFGDLMKSGEIVKYQPRNETEARLYRDYMMRYLPSELHFAIIADFQRYLDQFGEEE